MALTEGKPVSALFTDVVDQLGHLVATEVRLAQAELSRKIEQAAHGAALLLAGGVFMIPAVVMILIALALWLTQQGVPAPLSYLISAVLGGVLGAALLLAGLGRLNAKNLKLTKTIYQINQDLAAARNLTK